ncbi:MFS general substrate transporter [Aspergillus californicus]
MAIQEVTVTASRLDASFKKPVDFSPLRKHHIVLAGTIFALNASLGTSLPSGATTPIAAGFNIPENDQRIVLLNSLYLVGFVFGPLLFGPLSEYIGRRPVMIGTYLGYTAFTLACALAPSFEALLVFRLCCGFTGSAVNAVLGGLYSDIYDEPGRRGLAMAIFMFTAMAFPMAGPLVSGFTVLISWRWVFWVALIVAGVGVPVVGALPETYLPVLEKHAKKDLGLYRGGTGSEPVAAAAAFAARRIFVRPFSMLLHEPIVLLTSLYLAVVYGILFLFFQAYPIVFEGVYGLSNTTNGLAFIPMIFGSLLGLFVFLAYASYHSKALSAGNPWASIEEHRRLPLACIGAPSIVIALFWLAWTSYTHIHPAVPMMAGIFFGFGYLLVFVAMLNYLTDAYKERSASAQAAASSTRALMAVVLPFAADPMFQRLGVHWANSLLGFVALGLAGIPLVFIRYGRVIRERSGVVPVGV